MLNLYTRDLPQIIIHQSICMELKCTFASIEQDGRIITRTGMSQLSNFLVDPSAIENPLMPLILHIHMVWKKILFIVEPRIVAGGKGDVSHTWS